MTADAASVGNTTSPAMATANSLPGSNPSLGPGHDLSDLARAVGATAFGDLSDWPDHWYSRTINVPSLHDRLERYLRLRRHTLSTVGLPRDEALADQAAYVMSEALELADAVADFIEHPDDPQRLVAMQREVADVVLSATTTRKLMADHGLDVAEVELLIEEKTQADRGRDAALSVTHCRVCACTDEDCSTCIKRTGGPCAWVEPYVAGKANLCTACVTPV